MQQRLRRDATYFVPRFRCEALPRRPVDEASVNILFLTSVRDTGSCDLNGSTIETPDGPQYMEGVIERTVKETHRGGLLYGRVRVVGVITDDRERDLRDSDYGRLPAERERWIFPIDLRTPDGWLMASRTFNIPSDFRSLPKDALAGRATEKRAFELKVLEMMAELGVHVLVSDHYMARIQYLIGDFGLFGRVLNIHPAMTMTGHPFCFSGKTPTADAIARAGQQRGVMTGATLHIVDEQIDHGPILAYVVDTPVYPTDEPQLLRLRNYRNAKLPLFISGMLHYLEWVYPYTSRIDLFDLQPLLQQRVAARG